MNRRAVEHGEAAILPGEGEAEIGAAEEDGIGALLAAEPLSVREEDAALRLGDAADRGHLDVVLVNLGERLAFGQHDSRRGDPAIEPGLHDEARAENADRLDASLPDRGVDPGNGVEDR